MPKNRKTSIGMWVFIIAIVMFVYCTAFNRSKQPGFMTYSGLIQSIDENVVSKIVLDGDSAEVTIKDTGEIYKVQLPSEEAFREDVGEVLKEQMKSDGLIYSVRKTDYSFLSFVLPFIAVIVTGVLIVLLARSRSGRGTSFTRSHARLGDGMGKKIGFDDIAGEKEEKEELSEIVEFLKNPQKFIELGARIPKGILLVGSPGTGKTLLARAVAGEANVPFFSISGSDFVELYVGVGAARVRDLFEQAKKNKPCIIFIDEIDAVGRKRGAGMGGGHDEREQTLNQLLVEMDGFGVNEGIIMMAATNRPDILDPAILRAGRFDRQVLVDAPDSLGREEILKIHSKNKPLEDEVDLKKIAKVTIGYTGADLENLMNEAAIFAARRNKKKIDSKDIEDANLKVMMGAEKKSRIVSEKEKRLTAFHEAGHAVMAKLADSDEKVHRISIIPRGRAGGFTMQRPAEENQYSSVKEMMKEIMTLLGGRIAEDLVLKDISTGASNDLKRATEIARKMVTKYGMSESIGPVCYDNGEEVFIGRDFGHSRVYSEKTAADIDAEVRKILENQYKKGRELLNGNLQILHSVAEALLERETLDEAEFDDIINKCQKRKEEEQ